MIKFLDLHKINARFEADFQKGFKQVLDSGQYILGNAVSDFETSYANYCGSKYCVGTANGLDALTLILKSYIELGKLKKDDEVVVPANTFIATFLSVIHAGLKPVFAELNCDVDSFKAAITKNTKAIIVVHLYGQLVDVESINAFAKNNALLVIEDAAQAHGAKNRNGLKAGNLADAAAFSFYPSKNLGALGDGGAVTTSDQALYEMLKKLHNYGTSSKYVNDHIGFNSRLDAIQALFLGIKLKHLDADNQKRKQIAKRYLSEISNIKIKLPEYNGSDNHVFYAFVIQTNNREALKLTLDKHDIGYGVHYPVAPHKQKALKVFNNIKLPITEHIHDSVLSLPISPVITEEEVSQVIKTLNQY